MKLIIETITLNENDNGPRWLELELNNEVIEKIKECTKIQCQYDLQDFLLQIFPKYWDGERGYSLCNEGLVIRRTGLFFTSYNKYTGTMYESRVLELAWLEKILSGEEVSGFEQHFEMLFYSTGDTIELANKYCESNELNAA